MDKASGKNTKRPGLNTIKGIIRKGDTFVVWDAPNREAALATLKDFEQKWNGKYPYAVKSWYNNWEELTTFFNFPAEIIKIIYTTNLIENLNGKIRKYTKNKMAFPTDNALKESVYLAIFEITKNRPMSIKNWPIILNQFIVILDERVKI